MTSPTPLETAVQTAVEDLLLAELDAEDDHIIAGIKKFGSPDSTALGDDGTRIAVCRMLADWVLAHKTERNLRMAAIRSRR